MPLDDVLGTDCVIVDLMLSVVMEASLDIFENFLGKIFFWLSLICVGIVVFRV
jgi:hypothetical protein